jgi:hypothetical protein
MLAMAEAANARGLTPQGQVAAVNNGGATGQTLCRVVNGQQVCR